jgi:glycosyltransferase involved in cell wall biosynthesis
MAQDPDGLDGGTPRVSVCMATYNGSRWVTEQLASILAEIGPRDEVVVVDDASTDDTLERVRALADPRVRVVAQPTNAGYVRSFETALRAARGTYVLLADQDDVWVPGRVDVMLDGLGGHDVVASNLVTLGGPDRIRGPYGQADWRLHAAESDHRVRNVLGILAGNRPYYGCAMGVRREVLDRALPFPAYLTESHDLWLALYGNLRGRLLHIDAATVRRRFHDDNASPDRPRGVVGALRSRALLVRCLLTLWRR